MIARSGEDRVVRALLTAVGTLEVLVAPGHDSHTALNALEGIAYDLGEMDSAEHQAFIETLERIAAKEEPERAAWILALPHALGLDRS